MMSYLQVQCWADIGCFSSHFPRLWGKKRGGGAKNISKNAILRNPENPSA